MALQLWETFKEAITAYSGLSPASFFTIVALALAVCYMVSSMFVSPDHGHETSSREFEEQVEPLQPPVQLGEVTEEELKQYDGSDPKRPLLMAIKGQIYDVSQSRIFYGPGGHYHMFAGKDASRALAKMSFEEKDLTGDISGLGVFELDALQDWEYKFMSKYVKVGTLKKKPEGTTEGGDAAETSGEAAATETNATTEDKIPVEASDRDIAAPPLPVDNGPAEGGDEKIENKAADVEKKE